MKLSKNTKTGIDLFAVCAGSSMLTTQMIVLLPMHEPKLSWLMLVLSFLMIAVGCGSVITNCLTREDRAAATGKPQ